MLKRSTTLLVGALLAAPAAARQPVSSWGKAHVSYADYRQDSVTCSMRAAEADVRENNITVRYVQGFEVLERENNMPPMLTNDPDPTFERSERQVLLRRAYNPTKKVDQLQHYLVGAVEDCLRARKYVQFRLNRQQQRRLDKIKLGSDSRHQYLHSLASDPNVLISQVIPAG